MENDMVVTTEKCMEYELVSLLIEKGLHIAFAESCTAGLAAAKLVNVPDASKVLDVSFITYANEAKVKYVGVSEETIVKNGVVSEAVAGEMARGVAMQALEISDDSEKSGLLEDSEKAENSEYHVDPESILYVGVGISGIAGPTGSTAEKPVGMVCFGFYVCGKLYTFTEYFGDIGRNNVRAKSVEFCYAKLLELLKK